ncbi:MAG: DUF4243 domain-containing protein, partial [Acidobacteria bacterium]|nr:DUF4243 domain-containing protein [Acidobacteriota bacterium]
MGTDDPITRRRFARDAFLLGALAAAGVRPLTGGEQEDAMDEALEILASTGPEYGGGLANHGPMAAEALTALGRPAAVKPWLEGYRRRLDVHPDARNPVAADAWRETLGVYNRVGDFIALFDRELAERPWPAVLDTWSARLAPGIVGAAMHGVIRTGHAARSLAAKETPARRHELAEGLGYWAARYQSLPESEGKPAAGLLPSQAIRSVPLVPADQRPRRFLISDALKPLAASPAFASVIHLVDDSIEPSRFLSDLTSTFARIFVEEAQPGLVITLIHTVTGPSAVRLLVPHVAPATSRLLARYVWQAAAGVYAALGKPPASP